MTEELTDQGITGFDFDEEETFSLKDILKGAGKIAKKGISQLPAVKLYNTLKRFPEYRNVDLTKFTPQTLLTHFIAIRPQSAQEFIVKEFIRKKGKKFNEDEEDYTYYDENYEETFSLKGLAKGIGKIGSAVAKIGGNVISNVAKNYGLTIAPKEPQAPIVKISAEKPSSIPTPGLPSTKGLPLYIWIGAGMIVFIIILLLIGKK